jgi:hypothetical protein
LVVTVMLMATATAPRRGSSDERGREPDGSSLTALLETLLRVPGGAEVSGVGIRERLITLTVHARGKDRA